MKKIYLLLLIFASVLVNCGKKQDYSSKINKLESLLIALQDAENTFNALPHDSVKKQITYLDVNLNYIEEYFTDTLYGATATKFYDIKVLSENGLKGFKSHYYVVENELPFTQTQIRSLIEDLQKGKIDTLKANEYFETELNNAIFLIDAVTLIKEEFEAFPPKFFANKNFVDSLRAATEKLRYAI